MDATTTRKRPERITTYACGCVDREELNTWNHSADIHESRPDGCHHCSVIAPRPAVGTTTKFVRFGTPPASGRSWNGREGFAEAGVSAYAIVGGKVLKAPGYVWFRDRPAYQGVGVVVGYGSDDEILVEFEVASLRKIGPKRLAKLEG